MTHDELLAEIEKRYWKMFNYESIDQSDKATEHRLLIQKQYFSLRDVVLLHKPVVHIAECCKDTENPMDCSESYIACDGCSMYPCPTIIYIWRGLE